MLFRPGFAPKKSAENADPGNQWMGAYELQYIHYILYENTPFEMYRKFYLLKLKMFR